MTRTAWLMLAAGGVVLLLIRRNHAMTQQAADERVAAFKAPRPPGGANGFGFGFGQVPEDETLAVAA